LPFQDRGLCLLPSDGNGTAHVISGDAEKLLNAGDGRDVPNSIQVGILLAEMVRLTQSRITNDGEHMKNADNSAAFVDIQELLARVENDRELLCDLLTIFKQEFPTNLKSLKQAVARKDAADTARVSHTLKGMLANLSVTKAAASAARLEQLARAGETAALPDAFAAFAQDVHGLLPVMESYMAEVRS
jgi:two-component system sensor histidine kinase/response regulator